MKVSASKMAAEGCWLLLKKYSGGILEGFGTASIEMNVTKQTGFNSDKKKWNVKLRQLLDEWPPSPIVQFSAVENCWISKLGISMK